MAYIGNSPAHVGNYQDDDKKYNWDEATTNWKENKLQAIIKSDSADLTINADGSIQ